MQITSNFDTNRSDVVCLIKLDSNKRVVKRTLSLDDYRKAVSEIVTTTVPAVRRIGGLPAGFVDGGYNEEEIEAIIRVPEGRRPVLFLEKEYIVPFPEMVFYFKARLSDGRTTHSRVWCIGKNGELYHYPFGNVYDSGNICWGANACPRVSVMKDFEKLVSLFFSAGTNNDLYRPVEIRMNGKKVSLTQRELLEYLSRKKKCPKSVLVPDGGNLKNL